MLGGRQRNEGDDVAQSLAVPLQPDGWYLQRNREVVQESAAAAERVRLLLDASLRSRGLDLGGQERQTRLHPRHRGRHDAAARLLARVASTRRTVDRRAGW